jgi:hypothetical protein
MDVVVCGNCSEKRLELPQFGFEKPERVCDMCYKSHTDATPSMLYWMTHHSNTAINDEDQQPRLLSPHVPEEHETAESFLEQCRREQFTSADAPNTRVVEYWSMVVSDSKHLNELRGRVLVGIPNYVRGFVWRQLSEASQWSLKNPGLYESLSSKPHEEYDEMVANDVHRTFPTNPLFMEGASGPEMLSRILRAYCHLNEYSQCMSYIAAVLLMHMGEEDAFFVFVQMMKKYGLEAIFSRDLPACLRNYSRFIEVSRPELFRHLTNEKLSVEIFVSGWLQTLFAQQFDLGLVFRLWDVFFVYGFSFFIKVSLVLLEHAEPALLRLSNTDIIFSLKSLPMRIQDFDRLIDEAMILEIPDTILDVDTDEDKLLTITPTINFNSPTTIASSASPRASAILLRSSSSDLVVSPSSGSSPSTPVNTKHSSFRGRDYTPSQSEFSNSPTSSSGTPSSGFIRGNGFGKPNASSTLSASPSSKIQLM